MDHARVLAEQIGVDRLTWEITDHPESAYSRRFAPGTPDHAAIRREIWDDSNLGSAIPGATPRARIDIRRLVPGLPLIGRRSGRIRLRARVRNLSTRPFPAHASYGRRLVRLGAQLCAADGSVTNRDLKAALEKLGYTVDRRAITLHAPIKSLGIHGATVKLHSEVKTDVSVKVVSMELTEEELRAEEEAAAEAAGEAPAEGTAGEAADGTATENAESTEGEGAASGSQEPAAEAAPEAAEAGEAAESQAPSAPGDA
ncbi:MAG: hypothetical protein IIA41_01845 [SAR324 cluster bacterium]|nr:hypothetical protein [SAR324 cluster bacterium]